METFIGMDRDGPQTAAQVPLNTNDCEDQVGKSRRTRLERVLIRYHLRSLASILFGIDYSLMQEMLCGEDLFQQHARGRIHKKAVINSARARSDRRPVR